MPCVAQFDVQPAVEVWNKHAQRKPHQNCDMANFMYQEYVETFLGTSHETTYNDILVSKVSF